MDLGPPQLIGEANPHDHSAGEGTLWAAFCPAPAGHCRSCPALQQEGSLRGLSPVLPVHAAFSGPVFLGGKASATQGHGAMGEPVSPRPSLFRPFMAAPHILLPWACRCCLLVSPLC